MHTHVHKEVPMSKAYFNEPSPLKQHYPDEPAGFSWIQVVATICAVIAVLVILLGIKDWPGPWWLFVIVLLVPAAISAFLFWIAPHASKQKYERKWEKVFKANNADLDLDYNVIAKVIEYLRQNTSYVVSDFERIAISLAISLRQRDPFDQGMHNTFSWEVLHAYFHLKDNSKPFVITACPRDAAQ